MKKIFTIIALSVAGIVANGQGFIITSQVSAAVKTNTAAFSPGSQGSGTSGNVATTANQYFYALLYSSGSLTGSSAPTNSGWTVVTKDGGAFLGITNSSILAGGIAGTGGSGGVAINAAAGTPINVELVGWSASLGGATAISSVLSQFSTGSWIANGFFNYSAVSSMTPFATAGTGDPFIFPTAYANGSFSLYSVAVAPTPEPGTMALAALGGASLLLFRRRK